MEEIFIKNVMNVEVDGLKGINRYIIKSQHNVEQPEGHYLLKHRVIEDLTLTWQEIEDEGGISEINKQFKECYNL